MTDHLPSDHLDRALALTCRDMIVVAVIALTFVGVIAAVLAVAWGWM